jgi:DNA topoisomerase IB
MTAQRPHTRVSKKGKVFKAGRGNSKLSLKMAKQRKVYIPPAWKNVTFYSDEDFVATGEDEKGRLQYVYPKLFVEKQDLKKHRRINRLEGQIGTLMRTIQNDASKGNQEAQAIYTIYKTGFRPGTEKDTMADKKSYGIATLKKKHVKLKPKNIVEFNFMGKKGVKINKDVKDKKLYKIIKDRKNNTDLFDTNSNKVRKYFNKKTHNLEIMEKTSINLD